jgi:hypothetical protein
MQKEMFFATLREEQLAAHARTYFSSLRSVSSRDLRGHCILVDNSVNSLDLRIRLNTSLPGPDVVGEIPILSLPIDTSYAIARIASRPASTICPLPLFRQSGIRLRGWGGLADRNVTPYSHLALSRKINFLSLMSTRTVDDPLISFQTTYPLTEDERIASIQMRYTTPPVPARPGVPYSPTSSMANGLSAHASRYCPISEAPSMMSGMVWHGWDRMG